MSGWSLRLLGVGNASAVELGSAMATIESPSARANIVRVSAW